MRYWSALYGTAANNYKLRSKIGILNMLHCDTIFFNYRLVLRLVQHTYMCLFSTICLKHNILC